MSGEGTAGGMERRIHELEDAAQESADRIEALEAGALEDAATIEQLRGEATADRATIAELRREAQHDADQIANLGHAVDSRDIIGQAKGIIMNATGCDADEAFRILKQQSQAENRKLSDIAAQIASRGHFAP